MKWLVEKTPVHKPLIWILKQVKKSEGIVISVHHYRCHPSDHINLKMLQCPNESRCLLFNDGIIQLVWVELFRSMKTAPTPTLWESIYNINGRSFCRAATTRAEHTGAGLADRQARQLLGGPPRAAKCTPQQQQQWAFIMQWNYTVVCVIQHEVKLCMSIKFPHPQETWRGVIPVEKMQRKEKEEKRKKDSDTCIFTYWLTVLSQTP